MVFPTWPIYKYIGQSFGVFVFLQANYLVSFSHTWPALGLFPGVRICPSVKTNQVKASGRNKTLYGLTIVPWLLTHKETFCACVVSPLSQEKEEGDPLNLSSSRVLPPLCPCHYYYFTVFTREKYWLFTPLLLLFPFWRANRRLIINSLTGAHLSLVPGNTTGS